MRAGAKGGHIRDYLRNDRSIARMHARRRESARLVARLQACMPAQSPPRLSQRLWSVAGAWYAAPFYLPPFSFSLSLLPFLFSFFLSSAPLQQQTNIQMALGFGFYSLLGGMVFIYLERLFSVPAELEECLFMPSR